LKLITTVGEAFSIANCKVSRAFLVGSEGKGKKKLLERVQVQKREMKFDLDGGFRRVEGMFGEALCLRQ
jgi:hypothetical protein